MKLLFIQLKKKSRQICIYKSRKVILSMYRYCFKNKHMLHKYKGEKKTMKQRRRNCSIVIKDNDKMRTEKKNTPVFSDVNQITSDKICLCFSLIFMSDKKRNNIGISFFLFIRIKFFIWWWWMFNMKMISRSWWCTWLS